MNTVQKLVRSSLLLALAIAAQAIGRSFPQISQLFVGSIVNAVLIIATISSGMQWGILVGGLTPLLAWSIGQLPAPFGPFVPFIMIGNIIFVVAFSMINKTGDKAGIWGVIISSLLKFGFLSLASSKLITIFSLGIPKKVADKLIISMGTPQLITALLGGIIALMLTNLLKKRRIL
ncbi:hypothetical protein JOC70_000536 [Clostridium pascui]|uniref:ECF transporter S component n=1 Tax=Clostridium pascui TaxID=46609 RepID=UPI00195DB1DE|nr:ECF transporter S component [Clostridium pascui]MBM7869067.1 hypothetical protein [Clostridium pascui]